MNTITIRGTTTRQDAVKRPRCDGQRNALTITVGSKDHYTEVSLNKCPGNGMSEFSINGDSDPLLYFYRVGVEALENFYWTALAPSVDLGERGVYSLEGCERAHVLFETKAKHNMVVGANFKDVEAVLIALNTRPQDFVLQSSVDESTKTAEEVTSLSESIEEANETLQRKAVIQLQIFWKWITSSFVALRKFIKSLCTKED